MHLTGREAFFILLVFILFHYLFILPSGGGSVPFVYPCKYDPASSRREDNIKMNLREVNCVSGNLMDLAQIIDQWRAYARAVMNHRVS